MLSPFYLILASVDRVLITSRNARTRERSTIRLTYLCIGIVSLFWVLIHIHALVLPSFITPSPGVTVCYFQPGLHLMIMGYYAVIIKGILIPLLMIILGVWAVRNVRSLTHVTPVFYCINHWNYHQKKYATRSFKRSSTSANIIDGYYYICYFQYNGSSGLDLSTTS